MIVYSSAPGAMTYAYSESRASLTMRRRFFLPLKCGSGKQMKIFSICNSTQPRFIHAQSREMIRSATLLTVPLGM